MILAAAPVAAQDDAGCALLPESVTRTVVYAGYSASHLCHEGQGPLWRGLPPDVARITRFIFSDGHAVSHRWITITERPDGTAFAEVGGGDTPYRREHTVLERRRFAVSAETLANLTRLAAEAGTFDYDAGTWDGEEIFLHCQLLEMERADAQGYRFSSVNIGCNRPARLMPLVDVIIELAGIGEVLNGRAGR